ncbi:MAG: IS66 family insertion sequence element accessory protein TnpB [Candidatus Zixiibacteriota bacterium]
MFFPGGVKVYLAVGRTDMRKSIDGLSIMVSESLDFDPFSGHLFAFSNRRRTMIKVLYWDRSGFCLWQKRLEKDRFRWPESGEEVVELEQRELQWLLEGLEVRQHQAHDRLHYSTVF